MFTICPSCTRQFRIYAKHITMASGQVRCGFCKQQFNALTRLYDKPLTNEGILNEIQTSIEQEQQQQATSSRPGTPGEKTPTHIAANALSVRSAPQADRERKTAADKTDIKRVGLHKDDPTRKHLTGTDPAVDEVKETIEQKKDESDELGEFLKKSSVKNGSLLTVFWGIASFFALIIIVGQFAWFNRDKVLSTYPVLRSYVKQICQELGCRVIRKRDPDAIKLLNRDVRLHPGYEDTLLVNATIKNELGVRQAYPRIQLTIYDTAGTLLAYRGFMPTDYLDDSIDIDDGMPIDLPVHFVLEVTGPTSEAVSFEFRFF